MRQRLFLNGSRKNGFVVTVSTRALKVARRNSLSGLLHQNGTRPPSHLDERALAFMLDNRVRGIGRTGIKARLKIWNRRRRRQAIERANLLPRVVASEPSAHSGNIGAQRSSLYQRPDRGTAAVLWIAS